MVLVAVVNARSVVGTRCGGDQLIQALYCHSSLLYHCNPNRLISVYCCRQHIQRAQTPLSAKPLCVRMCVCHRV